ncbi:MAG: peroxidase [Planctomycetota bacterium]|nr:peroxidase [Planctomycetota bacterium]MDA1113565.1 peroxidase [Planctomycetota bacterium]
MAWIKQIQDKEAQGVVKKIFADAIRRTGRVWNIVRLTSLNGGMTRAHMGLYRSVMAADTSLSPRVRETLAVVVSQVNACRY